MMRYMMICDDIWWYTIFHMTVGNQNTIKIYKDHKANTDARKWVWFWALHGYWPQCFPKEAAYCQWHTHAPGWFWCLSQDEGTLCRWPLVAPGGTGGMIWYECWDSSVVFFSQKLRSAVWKTVMFRRLFKASATRSATWSPASQMVQWMRSLRWIPLPLGTDGRKLTHLRNMLRSCKNLWDFQQKTSPPGLVHYHPAAPAAPHQQLTSCRWHIVDILNKQGLEMAWNS